jgi:hypothetical protein
MRPSSSARGQANRMRGARSLFGRKTAPAYATSLASILLSLQLFGFQPMGASAGAGEGLQISSRGSLIESIRRGLGHLK